MIDMQRDGSQEYLMEADVHFTTALGLRPTSPYTWSNLAAVRYRLGDTGPAFERALANAAAMGPQEPEVQRNVVISAQTTLARRNLYRGEINGLNGPDLEFSLRAYQSRVGLPVTGRLDLETLAALELLPGANSPVYTPRGRVWPKRPVRGEWIHD